MEVSEKWKYIKGWDHKYIVSNKGRVKSLCGNKGEYRELILKPRIDKDGYFQVDLSNKNIRKRYFIHRLVAEAFIPNKKHYPVVNHKDEKFKSTKQAAIKYNLPPTAITACCKGKYSYRGLHPITGDKLIWKYTSEVI